MLSIILLFIGVFSLIAIAFLDLDNGFDSQCAPESVKSRNCDISGFV